MSERERQRPRAVRITVYGVRGDSDLSRIYGIVDAYRRGGHADGSRPRQRHCVLFGPDRVVAVWGGPEHIRIMFPDGTLAAEGE